MVTTIVTLRSPTALQRSAAGRSLTVEQGLIRVAVHPVQDTIQRPLTPIQNATGETEGDQGLETFNGGLTRDWPYSRSPCIYSLTWTSTFLCRVWP